MIENISLDDGDGKDGCSATHSFACFSVGSCIRLYKLVNVALYIFVRKVGLSSYLLLLLGLILKISCRRKYILRCLITLYFFSSPTFSSQKNHYICKKNLSILFFTISLSNQLQLRYAFPGFI